MDITFVVEALITLIFAVITAFLIPWIKTKISNEKLAEVSEWVAIAVQAAEMIYTQTGMGEKKKEYVVNFLESKGFKLDVDSINNLIEAAVLELKAEGAEIK